MSDIQQLATLKGFKYKIEQTGKGARITVHGDSLDDTVMDYMQLRQRLQAEGFIIAPEE